MNFNDIVRHCLIMAGINTGYGRAERLRLEADSSYGAPGALEQKTSAPYRNRLILQLLRVMRLTAFILLAACLQVAANGRAQTVTLSVKNAPIQKVFREIIRQTGVSIIYDETTFDNFAPVTLNVKDAPVQQVLDQCFKDKLFKVTFEKNTITIVSARSYEQTVSFSGKNVPLQAVFASIEKQTGFSFFFNYALLKEAKPVTLDVRDVRLHEILNTILEQQGLSYYVTGKTIFVTRKQDSATSRQLEKVSLGPNQVDISGRVVDQQGEPLAGATVSIKNGKNTTITDAKGEFKLKNVAVGTTLEITYLGYQKRSVTVNNGESIRVEMVIAENQLDQAQVIAYGNTTERLSTGNISIVKSEDIEKQPVSNPLTALEGRVPGLFITQANGFSGGGITVRIQGQNSIAYGNDPLYVIDGVPYASQTLPTVTGGVGNILGNSSPGANGGGRGNPLSYLNPSDIESIEVLKDADATAIYGSRAANGAILITTKRGKVGTTRVDINAQQGFGQDTRRVKLLNTTQYLEMRHEAFRNDAIVIPSASNYDINGVWDSTRYTDWQKTLVGGMAQYTNISAGISGGTANTQYMLKSTFHRETTVFPGSFSDQKGSVYFNLNSNSNDQRLKLQMSCIYLVDNNKLPTYDFTNTSMTLPPDAPALYKTNGTLNWQPNLAGASTWTNPLSSTTTTYQNKTSNLIANGVLGYQILPGLDIRSSFGYTDLVTNEFSDLPLSALPPENRYLSSPGAYYTTNTINSWVIEPQLNYKKSIQKGQLNFLLGTTIQQQNSNGYDLAASGYNSDAVLQDIHSATTVTATGSVNSVYKYNALFGRLNFNWDDKYIVDLNARRDGSSRFGPQSEFHNFTSAGLAWVFSQEGWFKNNVTILSFGKLRGSYGTTGNDQIGDYQFMNLYRSTTAGVAYQNASGLFPADLPNPYLQWEQTRKLQGGIDLGLLKDRIVLTVNYAYNRSSNELLSYALPIITGFFSINENFPATVQNTEWEYVVNTINIRSKNFSWTTGINMTVPKNKVVSFPNITLSSYATGTNGVIIGQPLGIAKVYHFLGVDPATGSYEIGDSHGNPTTSPNAITDRTVLINTRPKLYGGLENKFGYKGFQLQFMFQFVSQTGASTNEFAGTSLPGTKSNQPIGVLNRWQKPGDITRVQRFNSNNSLFFPSVYAGSSDYEYVRASYVRLKNVAISWEVPGRWIKKAAIRDMRIFAQGQNLVTFTSFPGLDPESQSVGLPPLKVVTFGLQMSL